MTWIPDLLRKAVNKYSAFHLVNISGWFVFIIYETCSSMLLGDLYSTTLIVFNITQWLVVFLLTNILRKIYQYVEKKNYNALKNIFIVIFVSLIFTSIMYFIATFVRLTLNQIPLNRYIRYLTSFRSIVFTVSYNFPIILTWSTLYFGIKYWMRLNEEKLKSEKAERMIATANLQMLRYQINPHFLFNSLNSVIGLIDENKKNAKEFINALAEFYRYSLSKKNSLSEPFEEELNSVKYYLHIEKMRFEDNLDVAYEIDPKTLDISVPSFILNPLIENAIKYSMQTCKPPIQLKIQAFFDEENFVIAVTNSGKWIENVSTKDNTENGVGIENVKKRLENTYKGKSNLEFNCSNTEVSAKITIPKDVL